MDARVFREYCASELETKHITTSIHVAISIVWPTFATAESETRHEEFSKNITQNKTIHSLQYRNINAITQRHVHQYWNSSWSGSRSKKINKYNKIISFFSDNSKFLRKTARFWFINVHDWTKPRVWSERILVKGKSILFK